MLKNDKARESDVRRILCKESLPCSKATLHSDVETHHDHNIEKALDSFLSMCKIE
jgi:hypothetical protein